MGYRIGPTLAVDGEKEYTAAMKRVKESMTYVKAEAEAATSAFDKNDRSIAALTTQNDGLRKSMQVQAEAVKAAEDALQRMRDNGVDPSSTAYKRMEANLNNAKAALNQTEVEIASNEKAIKECADAANGMSSAEKTVGAQAKAMGSALDDAGDKANSSKDSLKNFAKETITSMATWAAIIAAAKKAITALWETIDEASNWADELDTLSRQTGIATDTLQDFAYAAKFIDVEVETMTGALSRSVKAIREAEAAGQDYIQVSDDITVSTKDGNGQLRDKEQIFYDLLDAIGSITNETEREAAAQEIFGKSYQELMPLIKAGSGAIEEYGNKAKKAGAKVDDIAVAALAKLDDELEEVAASSDATGRKFAASMARITSAAATTWERLKKGFVEWGSSETLSTFFAGIIMGSQDAADAQWDLAAAIDNVSYITGKSGEELQAEVEAMVEYLYGPGVDSAEAYYDALSYIAQGYDVVSLAQERTTEAITSAQEQMSAEQANWDALVQTEYENYLSLSQQYTDAVIAQTDQYLSQMGGLFDAFPEKVKVTGAQLIANLQSQVDGFEDWSANIESLANRGIDEGLLQKLRDMGPEAAGEVEALNSMTDEQLQEYVDLYKQRSTDAESAAVDALEPMAEDVRVALLTVEQVIEDEQAAMEDLGENLSYGIGDGIASSDALRYIKSKAVAAVTAAMTAARKAGEVESPSKLMRDKVGVYLGEGLGVGMLDGMRSMIPDIKSSLVGMADVLASASSQSTSIIQYNTFGSSYSERDGAAAVRSLNRQLGSLYA